MRGWPLATRHRFKQNLPMFFSPRLGGKAPMRIAHAADVELFQCPVDKVDGDMAGLIVRRATDKQVRGYMLTFGTMCAAQVSEWLCSAIPEALCTKSSPSMAYAVHRMVAKEAVTAAAESGVGVTTAAAASGRLAAEAAVGIAAGVRAGSLSEEPRRWGAAVFVAPVTTAA